MSDPVTNVEIEDVLSSIRRLVSEGDRERPKPAQQADAAPQEPAKFVLTPALRVVDRGEEEKDDASDNGPVDDVQLATDAPETDRQEAAQAADQPFDNDSSRAAPSGSAAPRDLSKLEATIAELEAAVTLQPDDWEPDGSEQGASASWETPFKPAPRRPGPRFHIADVTSRDDDDPQDADATPMAEPTFQHQVIDESQDDHQDDLLDDDSDTAIEDEELAAYLDEGGIIDEQALRDLVADIIRQELQGTLGERITRNVRKLVRREIYRVLSSQEYEGQ
jgi:hypothetical protein